MNQSKLKEYIDNSFLGPLLAENSITDISFNGEDIYYLDNYKGRNRSEISITREQASDFIRQIANLSEKQFSVAEPFLDVSIYNYRIHAMHSSIGRCGAEKCITFDIRIGSSEFRLSKEFMDKESERILINAIMANESIIIVGPTGAGKTELQKYLLSKLKDNSRVIVIDNVQELEFLRHNNNIDLTSWIVDEFTSNVSVPDLIRNALRSNPDWIVLAEARGKEFENILNCVMTGHPIITTLHAKTVNAAPHRAARMVLMNEPNQRMEEILEDIYEHFKYYVFVNKHIDGNGNVHRFIENIGTINDLKKMEIIYQRKGLNTL